MKHVYFLPNALGVMILAEAHYAMEELGGDILAHMEYYGELNRLGVWIRRNRDPNIIIWIST